MLISAILKVADNYFPVVGSVSVTLKQEIYLDDVIRKCKTPLVSKILM